MAQQAIDLHGTLQIGSNGKPTALAMACLWPKPSGVEILLSADSRHVWLNLARDSALALAKRLIETAGPESCTAEMLEWMNARNAKADADARKSEQRS